MPYPTNNNVFPINHWTSFAAASGQKQLPNFIVFKDQSVTVTLPLLSLPHCLVNISCPLCLASVFASFSIGNRTNNYKTHPSNSMSEYSITKVIDGLFISDHLVPLDVPFLKGNKIICVVGWTNDQQIQYNEEDDIKAISMAKNVTEIKFPPFCDLEQSFKFLEVIHEEMLCGLIYSESQLEAALIGIMYLMFRYRWDCNTAYTFLKNKMDLFEFSDQAIDGLEAFQQQLQRYYNKQLTHILWEYQFLVKYRSDFDEETLLINTIKNKLRMSDGECVSKANKKVQRVRWYDQIRPSSAAKINSCKNLRRGSLNKGKIVAATQPIIAQPEPNNNPDLQLLYQSVGYRTSLNLKPVPKKPEKENVQQDDFDFMQLKEMSRTNFNDRKYMNSKLRRKGSQKPSKPQKTQSSINLHSISALVGIYSNSRPQSSKGNTMVRSGSGNLQFWNSLRNYSKISLGNA